MYEGSQQRVHLQLVYPKVLRLPAQNGHVWVDRMDVKRVTRLVPEVKTRGHGAVKQITYLVRCCKFDTRQDGGRSSKGIRASTSDETYCFVGLP